jgi:DNA-binding FrmR family transcriptional regulator
VLGSVNESISAWRGRGSSADKDQLSEPPSRIEGQGQAGARMIEEDRYCIDVLTQIAANRCGASTNLN